MSSFMTSAPKCNLLNDRENKLLSSMQLVRKLCLTFLREFIWISERALVQVNVSTAIMYFPAVP